MGAGVSRSDLISAAPKGSPKMSVEQSKEETPKEEANAMAETLALCPGLMQHPSEGHVHR